MFNIPGITPSKKSEEQPNKEATAKQIEKPKAEGYKMPEVPTKEQLESDQAANGLNSQEEPSHFDHLLHKFPDENHGENTQEDGADPLNDALNGEQSGPGIVGPEEFEKFYFKGILNLASMFTGLQSLKLPNSHVSDEDTAQASRALYDSIVDVPFLHFLLRPGGKWAERGFTLFIFGAGMAEAVKAEREAIRAAAAKDLSEKEEKEPHKPKESKTKPKDEGGVTDDHRAGLGAL